MLNRIIFALVLALTAAGASGQTYQNTISRLGVNSSATALGAAGVFTGVSEDVSNYADVTVSVFADQASGTDGLQIQQSQDGTNWDGTDAYTIPASTYKSFSFGVKARFARIVYTNGATPQTLFRLQTTFKVMSSKNSSIRPQDARSNDNDMEEQLSYQMIYNGTSWDRQRGDTTGGMYVQLRSSAGGGYSYNRISTLTTTTVKSGAGTLHAIVNGTVGTTSTIQCFDNTTATGAVILTASTVAPIALTYDVAFTLGLTCVTAGGVASDLTVSYK